MWEEVWEYTGEKKSKKDVKPLYNPKQQLDQK